MTLSSPPQVIAARRRRKGQALVEFALVSFACYLLMAAILSFGLMLYAAQTVQQAADLGARELSRTALPPAHSFDDALRNEGVQEDIYSEDYLVVDLSTTPDVLYAEVATWPVVNQQLFPLMIYDEINGQRLLRYPGALLESEDTPTGYTVGIPRCSVSRIGRCRDHSLASGSGRDQAGRWRWSVSLASADPDRAGYVALRINYPYQSATLSSFRQNLDPVSGEHPDPRFRKNIHPDLVNFATDDAVVGRLFFSAADTARERGRGEQDKRPTMPQVLDRHRIVSPHVRSS